MKIVLLGELNAGKIRFSNHETSWLMGVNFYFSIPDQNQFIIPCCQKPLHTLALCTPHSAGLCSKETSVAKSRKAHSDGLDSLFWEEEENPALDHKSKTKPRDDFLWHQTDEDGILGR